MKEAHAARAYNKCFRKQLQEVQDEPRPNVSQRECSGT